MSETDDKVKWLTKKLLDQGKLLEAGFLGLRYAAIPKEASETQLTELRMAFFAGAQHLFGSLMNALDPGTEPTDADMRRMGNLHKELTQFLAEFKLKHGLDVPVTRH